MKKMMERRKARGISGIPGMFKSLMAKQQEATSARAVAGTPAHNAQSTAGVPPSEEERRRRGGITIMSSSSKLG